jgi:uncharacterized repeat protein (TIGR03803 family)
MHFKLPRVFAIGFLLCMSPVCGQQYVVTDLSTSTYKPTTVNGISTPYQVGAGTLNSFSQALLWSGSAASVTNLSPSGFKSATAWGISGSTMVGDGVLNTGQTVALYWPAPIANFVINLNPTIGRTAAVLSEALGISGNQEVGYAEDSSGGYYAYLWAGSAPSAVDLHPAGYVSSTAYATNGSQQTGFATLSSGYANAMRWSGTAASAQNLNPAGFVQSFANGISSIESGAVAVGSAETSSGSSSAHAYAWGSVGAQDIHPTGFINSFATSISGTSIVGYGTTDAGEQVALLWQGINTTPINLNAFLPNGATSGAATSIDSSGNIAGYATFSGSSLSHAILWQKVIPPSFTTTAQNVSATLGILYSFTFKAAGSPVPTFSLTSGTAPPGLTLSSTGTFSGTPTTAGTFTGTVSAANGASPNASQNFIITINPTPVQSYAVLHSFLDGSVAKDGIQPGSGLVQGSNGNFYGVTSFGGSGANISGYAQPGSGTIFKLSPEGTYSVLHNFCDRTVPNDGALPASALIEGTDGNYYGVTENGGLYGDGTVFKMTAQGVVTILHSFGGVSDGTLPGASLIQASDGNFYGSTVYGGSSTSSYSGTLFRISSTGSYSILHNFRDGTVTNDGEEPSAALLQASDGNLYGTTDSGGSAGFGTLYQVTLQGSYTLLRSFGDGTYGSDPEEPSALAQGADGNFYATAAQSTSATSEVAFKMTLQGAPTILHVFGDGTVANDGASSGQLPTAGLIQGGDGNFYGTTVWGGASYTDGVAFKMTPTGSVNILHAFNVGSVPNDGIQPYNPLCQGFDGNLYGTTSYGGGIANDGTLFQIFLIGGQTNPVAITSTPPLTATAGSPFNFSFAAQGSPAPTFSVTSGSLPPGLSLSSLGLLSGTPTSEGAYTFTLTGGNGMGTTVSQSVTLTIVADTPVMPPWGLALLALLLFVTAIKQRLHRSLT